MDTDSFIAYIKTDDIGIAEDVETRFDTTIYELDTLFTKSKKKSNWISKR